MSKRRSRALLKRNVLTGRGLPRTVLVGAGVFLGLVIWLLAGVWFRSHIAVPSYELLERTHTYEVRHYPELTVARIAITGPYEEAISQARGALSAYRSGNNIRQPVESTDVSEVIPASGPLVVEQKAGELTVSLILPAEYTPDTAPRPKDPRVLIKTFERQRIAVWPMSGSVDAGVFVREGQALLAELRNSQLLILSEPRAAYYDPSWIFAPLRRAEVHVRVR